MTEPTGERNWDEQDWPDAPVPLQERTIVATGETTFHGPDDWDLGKVEAGQHDVPEEWIELCLLDPSDQEPVYRTSQGVLRLTTESARQLRDQLNQLILGGASVLIDAVADALEDRGATAAAQLVRDTDPEDDLWNNYLGPVLDELEDDYTAIAAEMAAELASNEQTEGKDASNEQAAEPV